MQNDVFFEINPLDMAIAKIEFELIKQIQNNAAIANGYSIEKEFESKNPEIDLKNIKILFSKNDDLIQIKGTFEFKNDNSDEIVFKKGTEKEILEYLNSKHFFAQCKAKALKK